MDITVALAVFPVIFLGELPDKTMFASLVLSSRGRPSAVWLGAAAAFLVHVVIAVTIGVGMFHILPEWAVESVVAVLFLFGAVMAFREARAGVDDEEELIEKETASHTRVGTTAFFVVFIAEWGDLTQILTANMAAKYGSPLWVAVGAALALWAVAGIAVVGGQTLLKYLPVTTLRKVMGCVLLVLAAWSAYLALT